MVLAARLFANTIKILDKATRGQARGDKLHMYHYCNDLASWSLCPLGSDRAGHLSTKVPCFLTPFAK